MLVELTWEECLAVLEGEEVARVAVSTPVGPRIFPVNYTLHGAAVYFRTMPFSLLGSYGWGMDVAVEVDALDKATREGVSVVAVGRARLVEDPQELAQIHSGWNPDPWAGARNRCLYVAVPFRELTGRRVLADSESPTRTAGHALH